MDDITIVRERGKSGTGTIAKVIPNNVEANELLEGIIEKKEGCFTIHSDLAEEMAETLREKGLTVVIK